MFTISTLCAAELSLKRRVCEGSRKDFTITIPIFPASSHSATDIKNSKQLRKFTFPRHNLQLLSSGVSVGVCSDQLQSGKLFNAEEFFQKRFSDQDGGDQYEREVIVRTLAAKKPFTKASLDPTRGTEYVIYLIK